MIGIIIVAHVKLAQEFLGALEHVMGPQEAMVALSLSNDGNIDEEMATLKQAIKQVDRGKGVIILTDLFGGSPSNLAIAHLSPGHVDVIAGVNLPLLVKLATIRASHPLEEATRLAQETGKNYIHVASQLLKPK